MGLAFLWDRGEEIEEGSRLVWTGENPFPTKKTYFMVWSFNMLTLVMVS